MIPPLCFITDADADWPLVDQAIAAARGGAKWVQLRAKGVDDDLFIKLAEELNSVLLPLGAELILNDRLDIAAVIPCRGLHIGQSDGDPRLARALIGPDKVLGLSIENATQLADIPKGVVDYLGVGPVLGTQSKSDAAPPIGFDGLRQIVAASDLPCMAIGGLNVAQAPVVRDVGCAGLAVISAISRASDPTQATRDFIHNWSIA